MVTTRHQSGPTLDDGDGDWIDDAMVPTPPRHQSGPTLYDGN